MNKRTRYAARSLALVTALTMCLAAAAMATAAPKDCEDLPPSHPRYCGASSSLQECEAETTDLDAFPCLWTPSEDAGLLVGTVTVEPLLGTIDRLVVFVRDADPGDICALEQSLEDTSTPPYEVEIPLADERGTYWDFPDGHWCEPYDPILGQRDDPNGMPLVVDVGFRTNRGTQATITITP